MTLPPYHHISSTSVMYHCNCVRQFVLGIAKKIMNFSIRFDYQIGAQTHPKKYHWNATDAYFPFLYKRNTIGVPSSFHGQCYYHHCSLHHEFTALFLSFYINLYTWTLTFTMALDIRLNCHQNYICSCLVSRRI